MDEEGTAAGSSSQQHAQGTQESTQGATQPVVRDFITDIFGEDSDDENDAGPSSSSSSSNRAAVSASKPLSSAKDDDDGIFADSDDDAAPSSSTAAKTSRLRKGGISQAKPSSSSSSSSSGRNKMDDLFGDDDDDDDDGGHAGGRADKISKKKRRESGRDRPEQRLKKRRVTRGGGDGDDAGAVAGADDAVDDGDEYDSGDEVHRTAEDDNFIDDDDDLADIRGEYDAEDQIFDDERPAFHKKPPASSKRGSSGDSGGVKKGADDPFSKTLEAMKKPKQKEMSDNEKDKVADQLLRRMGEACVRDDACFREGQPAVHKLQLLKTVQSVVAVKALQHTLLERDLLGALRDWIEPKNDAQKTLPSLAIRTAVYEILMKLPCHTDQLKRSDGLKKPIGHVVLALRKHKQETPENKRLLKELMEKWCRPVFRKVRPSFSHVAVWGGVVYAVCR
jgi:transcription factor SPN1